MGTPTAFVAKSLRYNKYGIGSKDILSTVGFAGMKEGHMARAPLQTRPQRWDEMENKEEPQPYYWANGQCAETGKQTRTR